MLHSGLMIEYYLNGESICVFSECDRCPLKKETREEVLLKKLKHMYMVLRPFKDDEVKGNITLDRKEIEILMGILGERM